MGYGYISSSKKGYQVVEARISCTVELYMNDSTIWGGLTWRTALYSRGALIWRSDYIPEQIRGGL